MCECSFSVLSVFALLTCPSLSIVLVNRLVLNLRRNDSDDSDETVQSIAILSFAVPEHSFLGNIGAPLRDGMEDYTLEGESESESDVQLQVLSDVQPKEE